MKILIVEDEAPLANGLRFNFEQEGYETVIAGDGATALREFEQAAEPFDLIVLDLMLPGMSGYETCRKVREIDRQVPILVLSARTLSEDRMQAFDAGTDQYMSKPFALPELLSRVRNLLQRHPRAQRGAAPNGTALANRYQFGDVVVDFGTFEVTVAGTKNGLTTMEMQLLRYFIEHEGVVLSRNQILKDVWDQTADVTTRTIDNFVMRLRKLIERDPTEPRHLLSVRGTGYRFVANPMDLNRVE
jgi:two-component system OmpR family response regulator